MRTTTKFLQSLGNYHNRILTYHDELEATTQDERGMNRLPSQCSDFFSA